MASAPESTGRGRIAAIAAGSFFLGIVLALVSPLGASVASGAQSVRQSTSSLRAHSTDNGEPQSGEQAAEVGTHVASAAVSGKLWTPKHIRSWDGELLFNNGRTTPRVELPESTRSKCKSEQWVVVTTIFPPSPLLEQLATLPGWCSVVVADRKTPVDAWASLLANSTSMTLLTVAQQEQLPFASAAHTPWNHFGRKNLGYIYAVAHGAHIVYDTDDDNELREGGWPAPAGVLANAASGGKNPLIPIPGVHLRGEDLAIAELCSPGPAPPRVWNPYPLFGGGGATSWPRGFPLDDITDSLGPCGAEDAGKHALQLGAVGSADALAAAQRVAIWQSLADEHPDIDGIHRLTRKPLIFAFDSATPQASLVGPAGVNAPYNAQATLYTRRALWGLLLPVTVHGRVSDIWRSYIVTRLLAADASGVRGGMQVAFVRPWVKQMRTPHNFLKDFQAELPLYERAGALAEFLRDWKPPTTGGLPAAFEALYIALYEVGVVEYADVQMAQTWLRDLSAVGYDFSAART